MEYCEAFSELISAKLDGELTAEESVRLSAHLEHCADCRALLAELEEIDAGLQDLRVEPPGELARGVMERLDHRESTVVDFVAARNRRRHWQPFVAAAAAVVLMIAGGVYLEQVNAPSVGSGSLMTADYGQLPAPTATADAELEVKKNSDSGTVPQPTQAVVENGALEGAAMTHGEETTGGQSAVQNGDKQVSASPKAEAVRPSAEPKMVLRAAGGMAVEKSAPERNTQISEFSADTVLAENLSEADACRKLFEFLRTQNFPDLGGNEPWDGAALSEEEGVRCTFAPLEKDGETFAFVLKGLGQSWNKKCYEFTLYADVTDGSENWTAQAGRYAVEIAGGGILDAVTDEAAYLAATQD